MGRTVVTSDNTIDVDSNNRMCSPLDSGRYGHNMVLVFTKCKMYKQLCFQHYYFQPSHTLSAIDTLENKLLLHLRQILLISWKDNIPNVDVLRQANVASIKATLPAP